MTTIDNNTALDAGTTGPLPAEVPVLIVGGGAAGLAISLMLGVMGVRSLLVERHPGTSLVPKAHIIHTRTMEIFQQFGLAAEVRAAGAPSKTFSGTSWYTSLGGDEVWDRQLIATIPSWSGGSLAPFYEQLTSQPMANLPQHLLEPILRARCTALNGDENVRFLQDLVQLEQTADSVIAVIKDRTTGSETPVSARYVVAADGGKTVGSMLGIEMEGPEPFVDIVSLTFSADLAAYLQEDHSLIRLFLQPQLDGTVRRFSIVASGPDTWDRTSQQWRGGVVLPVGSELHPESYTTDQAVDDLRRLLKLPDLQIADITMSHWLIESVVAERFSEGKVFLIGDAAHRHSPMGGLGLNTGIQDAHNLAWKLSAVLRGYASPQLLDSYEAERRPVARQRVDFATFSFFNHLSVSGGFGMLPGASEPHNRAVLESLFADTGDGARRRAQLEEMIHTLRREFQHAAIDLGFDYADSPTVTPDGTPPPADDPVGREYVPTARPGHRMPHALLCAEGKAISTHELLDAETFLLLAGPDGQDWCSAGAAVARQIGIPLRTWRVGPGGDLEDPDDSWAAVRGHDDTGAMLVRPDGHVAFRSLSAVHDVEVALLRAFGTALGVTTTELAMPRS